MHVTILGMGEIGSALSHILSGQKHVNLRCWDKNAAKAPNQTSLEDSIRMADLIFVCVPSWNLRGALINISPFMSSSAGIISLAKGMEKESHKTVDEILQELSGDRPFGILGGPMIAEEMLTNKLTSGAFATTSPTLRSQVKRLFKGSRLRIRTTQDVRGTALCGLLKNVYTLSLGIAEGLELGENAKGTLFSCALKEMQVLTKLLGGKPATVLSLAGAGDFYATSLSTHSRNLKVGIVLGTGGDGHLESEGFVSLRCLSKLIPTPHKSKLPLLTALIEIAEQQAPASVLTQAIFTGHSG